MQKPASLGGSARDCRLHVWVGPGRWNRTNKAGGNHQGQRSMSGQFGMPCLLAHIHLDRGRYASSLQCKPGFTHGSPTQSWMLGMPLLWTLKTSSAAPMRDTLMFLWPSLRYGGSGHLGLCLRSVRYFPSWFRRVYFSYHARIKTCVLRPPGLLAKRRPPGKDSAQSSVDLGAVAAKFTETDEEKILTKQAVRHRVAPEAEAWFLDYAAMQEAAVCAVLRTVTGRSLACP